MKRLIFSKEGIAIVGKKYLYCFDWCDTRKVSYTKHSRFIYRYEY
jgi:hypothetical protein